MGTILVCRSREDQMVFHIECLGLLLQLDSEYDMMNYLALSTRIANWRGFLVRRHTVAHIDRRIVWAEQRQRCQ